MTSVPRAGRVRELSMIGQAASSTVEPSSVAMPDTLADGPARVKASR